MPGSRVQFEVVDEGTDAADQAPSGSAGQAPEPAPEELEEAKVEPFDEESFPLAGPILESSSGRELKGRCSSCETRLRIRVKGPGTVRVRCPICGHARRIEV